MSDTIYLDHNATTPVLPEVLEAMLPYLREQFGNPSSAHVYGRRAKEAVVKARAQVAALIGAAPEEIVFTASGSEGNNLVIRGSTAGKLKRHLVTSAIEHAATLGLCRMLEAHGFPLTVLPVNARGRVELDAVRGALRDDTALVTLMHANNETGVLQPVAEVGAETRKRGVLFHVDAAQTAGKVAIDVNALKADLVSFVGHKFYGPKGIGAVYIRNGVEVQPIIRGGGQERGVRPGTENVPGIVGLGAACERARKDLEVESARQRALRDELFSALKSAIPSLELNGDPEHRLPNTLNVRFKGVIGGKLLEATPEIAAATGSACHEGEWKPSAVITAMGVSPDDALGSVRLTLGRMTTREDVKLAAVALTSAYQKLTAEKR